MDMGTRGRSQRLEPFLNIVRDLPFVKKAEAGARAPHTPSEDLRLLISDRRGRCFRFRGELKMSYLDRATVNAVVANARLLQKEKGEPVLVLARYIPLPTGEQLVAAGVNFLDLIGNMHLMLGADYERTVLGRVEPKRAAEKQRVTAAKLQLLFLFATHPEAASWPVRDIGLHAGMSKSKAADLRREMIDSKPAKNAPPDVYRMSKSAEELLISGYAQMLRPKLVAGRFRPPERDVSDFLKRLRDTLQGTDYRYALSGGPAADVLQHFYRGADLPLFISDAGMDLRQKLRLLPDRNGPITLLRSFGEVVYWREVDSWMLAPPWLIYAELLNSPDPRAHEAAAELRREFLTE